jgi:hypothetical protein
MGSAAKPKKMARDRYQSRAVENGKLVPVFAPASTAFASTTITSAASASAGTLWPIFARLGLVDRQRASVQLLAI